MEFCVERGLCVGNTFFKHRSLGKEYDRSSTGEEGYAVLCVGCEGSEGNGTTPIRSPCGTI